MTTVFISYSRKDAAFVRRLHDALGEQDHETWVDWEGIAPTAEWMKEIVAAIDEATAFVFVMSPDSLASKVCLDELAHAVAQNKRLIPIVHRDIDVSSAGDSLAKLNWIFFREADDFSKALQTLVAAIDTDLEWVKAHTRLLVRAREWDAKGRDGSLALRGKDLQAAEQWLLNGPSKEPQPTELQTRYILQSRSVATRRRYALLGSTALALVIVAVLGTTTYFERRNAARQQTVALAGRLTADAELARDQHETGPADVGWVERSLLLATEATRQLQLLGVRSLQTDIAMRRSLALFPRRVASVATSSSRSGVDAMVLTADGRVLAASKSPLGIRQWSAAGEAIASHDLAGGVEALAFSPDGKFLATTELNNAAGVIDVWDATLQSLAHFAGNGDKVRAFALSPDATYVLASTERFDGRSNAWVAGPTLVRSVRDANQPEIARLPPTLSASFSLDGVWIAAIVDSAPAVWKLSDAQGFDLQKIPLEPTESDVSNVYFSADGKHLVVSFQNNDVKVWRVGDWKMVRAFRSETLPWAVGPDARYAVVKRDDYTASVLDTDSGDEVARVHAGDQIEAMAVRPDSQAVAVAGLGKSIGLWQIDSGGSDIMRVTGEGDFRGASFSSDEATLTALLAQGESLSAQQWRFTDKHESSRHAFKLAADVAAFSAEGRSMAVASAGVATVINADDGKALRSFEFEGKPTAMALSADGASLAIATDAGLVLLWPAATSTTPTRFEVRGMVAAGSLAVGPSATTLLAIVDEGVSRRGQTLVIHAWKPADATEADRVPLGVDRSGLSATPCAVSTDARYVAATLANDLVVVREAFGGRLVATINHPGTSRTCAFSADGRLLATSGSGVVRVWEIATQVEIARLEQLDDVRDLIFSPKARYVATVGQNDSLRIWLLDPADLLATACGRLSANLSPEEWRGYFGDKPYAATCTRLAIPSATAR